MAKYATCSCKPNGKYLLQTYFEIGQFLLFLMKTKQIKLYLFSSQIKKINKKSQRFAEMLIVSSLR